MLRERVQMRAVKKVSGLTSREYKDGRKELGLETLEERRHQADMAMVQKILHGKGSLEPTIWFDRPDATGVPLTLSM